MTSKVLVADDSLTIQKVIGITLANSGYELVECLNEAELLKKIQSNHFDLVLLDFNLSDSRSGYELAKQINLVLPRAAIIVMLGTFDTVDESKFEENGITEKIVKPFESTKFIKKCRDLLEGARPLIAEKISETTKTESYNKTDDLDQWQVNAPQILSKESEGVLKEENLTDHSSDIALDPLSSEIEGWGFALNNSLEEKFQKVFPPVIEEASETSIIDRLQSSSQFVNSDDFDEDTEDLDATDPSFEVSEDLNRNLLNEIEEEVSAEAFWAVDEVLPVKSEDEEDIIHTNFDEITADFTDISHAFKEKESLNAIKQDKNFNQDELVEKLKIALRPMIEEMVKEFCRQSAEKVAWEVIPDLAENLIRKEIKEISDSLQH